MPVTKRVIIFLPVFLGAMTGLLAETPSTGDPNVAYLFLLHQQGLLKEVAKIAASTPAAATDTKKAAAASMNLAVSDFDEIGTVYSQVEPLLEAVDREANLYRDRVVSGAVPVDVNVLKGFDARKTQIKATISQRLKAALSPAGWTAMNAYIEGSFRYSVYTVRRQR